MLKAKRRVDARCVEGEKGPESEDELERTERGEIGGGKEGKERVQLRRIRFRQEDEKSSGSSV